MRREASRQHTPVLTLILTAFLAVMPCDSGPSCMPAACATCAGVAAWQPTSLANDNLAAPDAIHDITEHGTPHETCSPDLTFLASLSALAFAFFSAFLPDCAAKALIFSALAAALAA